MQMQYVRPPEILSKMSHCRCHVQRLQLAQNVIVPTSPQPVVDDDLPCEISRDDTYYCPDYVIFLVSLLCSFDRPH